MIIVNRFTGATLYEGEHATLREAVLAAVAAGADLSEADLSGADLSEADLSGADLSEADLSGADLWGADLSKANLWGADLSKANLSKADLSEADLSKANLSKADLSEADLSGADLWGADLSKADLSEANLDVIKADLWMVLTLRRKEVPGLLTTLRDGRVDGSTYEGECACLCGTIANELHCSFREIPGLAPNADRPIERWFLAIRPGDTPETSQVAKITEGWIWEWQAAQGGETA